MTKLQLLSDEFIEKYKEIQPPMTEIGSFVFYRTYSRYLDSEQRREYWWETVRRAVEYNCSLQNTSKDEAEKLFDNIFNLRQFLSGRTLYTGGTLSSVRFPSSNFNCASLVIKDIESFHDMFYLLMLGCGVGFRVLEDDIKNLPKFKTDVKVTHLPYFEEEYKFEETDLSHNGNISKIVIGDSKNGWTKALEYLLTMLTCETIEEIIIDYNNVRPKGSRLKTFGGTASGHEAIETLFRKICNIISNTNGRLKSIDCLDICNLICEAVVVGGVRRSASIAMFDISDNDIMNAKNSIYYIDPEGNWQTNVDLMHRTKSNNSILFFEKPSKEKLTEIFESIKISAEPGFFNAENAKKVFPDFCGTNPCIVGSTLVSVADGRGKVSIADLAIEGKDVNVHCLNDKGKLVVRTMRNPRVTGYNQPIYEITLDDGNSVKTTGNHKFMLNDDSYKEVKDLVAGDSLKIVHKKQATFEEIIPKSNSKSSKYNWMSVSGKSWTPEHRLIAENAYGNLEGLVVHHINRNSLDNRAENLQVMTKKEHDALHAIDMMGENNPVNRFPEKNIFNNADFQAEMREKYHVGAKRSEQTCNLIKEKAQKRMQDPDKLRKAQETIKKSQQTATYKENFNKYIDNKSLDFLEECQSKTDLKCILVDNCVYVEKTCELCGNSFSVPFGRREQGFCGHSCSKKYVASNKDMQAKKHANQKIVFDEKTTLNKEAQIKCYLDLKFSLNRTPMKTEWESECSTRNIRKRLGGSELSFKTYKELQEHASLANHRVVKVQLVGHEDVYNGTVDEFHNFLVGGFDNVGDTEVYLVNRQCGETFLPDKGFCNLVTTNIMAFVDNNKLNTDKLIEAFILNARANLRMASVDVELPKWDINQKKYMILGCSMTGWQDAMSVIKYDKIQQKQLLSLIKQSILDEVNNYAKELGINEPTLVTLLKPEGTLSLLPTVSSGLHHSYAPYYIRRVRINANDPLLKVCQELGYNINNENGQTDENCTTKVVDFYVKAPVDKTIKDVSAIEQLEDYKMFMQDYVQQNASNTITVKYDEWQDVVKWVYDNWEYVVGLTFLSSDDSFYQLMPYEAITKEQYDELTKNKKPFITPELIAKYEKHFVEQELDSECSSGHCPVR